MNLLRGVVAKIGVFLEMIKFPHTVFALPFALASAILAVGGLPAFEKIFWIILAMVGARTAAMGLNRLIDAEIDARNPRTARRAIPAGLIGKGTVFLFVIFSLGLLLLSAARLNPLCLKLSPVAIFLLVSYSYCKRFTALSHIVLGMCLSSAPIGAWLAVRGDIEATPVILAVATLFWTAGFDILYALQDLEFDRATGLHSVPVLLGTKGALIIAKFFHAIMLFSLTLLFFTANLGIFFIIGLALISGMILYEHMLLKDGDLSKLDTAFFNMNGYISVTMLISVAADVFVRKL